MVCILLSCILSSCTTSNKKGLPGDRPPSVFVELNGEKYSTTQGSYCWTNMCVDKVGPPELLQNKKPIRLTSKAIAQIKMDYKPQPTEVHLSLMEGNEEKKIQLKGDGQFKTPTKKGVYYYVYSVWWDTDEKGKQYHGDAAYVFSLEIE
ncbi:hypothetical protein M2M59_08390 [Rummeliibacillus sp. G93]|uniref:hypothetical protein n=1 Tax=Rummeliibacillus sp. G93 TaxID=2939494 RepID=UPI00201C27B4|nr:hypothetical protein [Rummeliibacillus sp. G93]UQW96039.1 hypothetical protein M2M59_08390 [Rummeliibacillus sp. G93]